MWCEFTGWVVIMSEFKVGDRVYCPSVTSAVVVLRKNIALRDGNAEPRLMFGAPGDTTIVDSFGGLFERALVPAVHFATPENYELLSKLYPNVKFEKPKLTGSDLTRQLLAEGAKEVLCWVDDGSDEQCVIDKTIAVVFGAGEFFKSGESVFWKYAVPIPRNHYAMDDSDE